MSRHTPDGRQYRKQNQEMLAGGPTCWTCGHPGADQAGHILPASLFPELAHDPANRRPEHGWRGCPVCHRKCNQERGTKVVMPTSPRSRRW